MCGEYGHARWRRGGGELRKCSGLRAPHGIEAWRTSTAATVAVVVGVRAAVDQNDDGMHAHGGHKNWGLSQMDTE